MSIKICFRGDDRKPLAPDMMFQNGFKPRDISSAGPNIRKLTDSSGRPIAGDIEPTSAVCVSARLSAAAMFPLMFDRSKLRTTNYIYVLALDTATLTNTHAIQASQGLKIIKDQENDENALWPLFGHELATLVIRPQDIIAAIKCDRSWRGRDWSEGGSYALTEIQYNGSAMVTDDINTAARNFIANEIKNYSQGSMPQMNSGYTASNPYQV